MSGRTSGDRAGRPPFVGLTGGIGAGKSTALAALERLGAATLSADAVVHELYADAEVVGLVRDRWGEEMVAEGAVDRAAVARAAFATEDDRRWLEQLVWPRVGRRMWEWRQEQEARDVPAMVVEVPLLFESGMEEGFDATIAVVAREELRARRAEARGHQSLDERTARQLTQEEKAARADHVVANDGSVEELEGVLSEVLATLTGSSAPSSRHAR